MPYGRTSMPLGPVTSVKCSVRVPSAPTTRSLRKRRSPSGPAGGYVASFSVFFAPSICALHQVDVEVAVVVVVEQGDAGRHDLRVVPLARHAVEVDEVEAGLFGALDEPLRRLRAGRLAPKSADAGAAVDGAGFLSAPHETRARAASTAARDFIWDAFSVQESARGLQSTRLRSNES